jgi:hypothetical protein
VNPTISCLAMVFLVGGEEAKSELSCCDMKTQSNMLKQSKYRASPETTSDGLPFGCLGE